MLNHIIEEKFVDVEICSPSLNLLYSNKEEADCWRQHEMIGKSFQLRRSAAPPGKSEHLKRDGDDQQFTLDRDHWAQKKVAFLLTSCSNISNFPLVH